MVIHKRLMTFYSGLCGIVWLVRYPIACFAVIFAGMGWSLQSVWVKQLMFCKGKELKLIRFHHCI